MIPKDTSDNAVDLRPISVMSAVYRLWAAVRLIDFMKWQESWISGAQDGARKQHGTEYVFWALALKIEFSVLTGKPLYGAALDYKK